MVVISGNAFLRLIARCGGGGGGGDYSSLSSGTFNFGARTLSRRRERDFRGPLELRPTTDLPHESRIERDRRARAPAIKGS